MDEPMEEVAAPLPRATTPGAPAKPAKTKVSPARNVVGVVLFLVFATVAAVEFYANRQATSGVAKLDAKLANEQDNMLTLTEVNAMLGKAPDGPPVADKAEQKMTYTWKGLVRKHGIVAFYTLNKEPKLIRYEGF